MPALATGVRAPEIKLSSLDGRKFSLSDAIKQGPVVAAFFKVSCPVCQFAFPYVERMFQAYGKSGSVSFVGISQDNSKDTQAFNRQFGVTFSVLLDEKRYPVSSAYGLTNVPTVFLISSDGEIEFSSVGWSKADMLELNAKLAAVSKASPVQIFRSGENVAEFKAG